MNRTRFWFLSSVNDLAKPLEVVSIPYIIHVNYLHAVALKVMSEEFVMGQLPAEAVMHGQMLPIRRRDSSIPSDVAKVIDQALAANAKDRYQSGAEFRDALKKVL